MNISLAEELATLSCLAYGQEAIVKKDDAFHYSLFKELPVIAFRGTIEEISVVSAIDWMNDANISLVKTSYCAGKVHSGFHRSLDNLWPLILNKLKDEQVFKDEDKTVLLTGHSKGGALATLAAKRFEKMGVKSIVYTFGSPRVGNKEFKNNYAIEHYRIEYKNDVVPHIPECDYHSVGSLCFIDWHNKIKKNSPWLEAKRGVKLFFAGTSLVTDHLIANYQSAMTGSSP